MNLSKKNSRFGAMKEERGRGTEESQTSQTSRSGSRSRQDGSRERHSSSSRFSRKPQHSYRKEPEARVPARPPPVDDKESYPSLGSDLATAKKPKQPVSEDEDVKSSWLSAVEARKEDETIKQQESVPAGWVSMTLDKKTRRITTTYGPPVQRPVGYIDWEERARIIDAQEQMHYLEERNRLYREMNPDIADWYDQHRDEYDHYGSDDDDEDDCEWEQEEYTSDD
jgi:hypothetical protein